MSDKCPTAGILLAAGMSRRFGSPKLLHRLQGRPLIRIALDAALDSRLDRVVLVLGHRRPQVMASIGSLADHPKLAVADNPDYPSGLSHSIRAGLDRIRMDYPSVMFLLADQPLVTASLINRLLDRYWTAEKEIGVPLYNGRRGNPTLFSRRFYPELLRITGDQGGRQIIRHAPDDVLSMEMEDGRCLVDIDRPSDLDNIHT